MAQIQRAAIFVEKGGVGKTTSTAHIGVAAAQDHGLEVLLLDLAGTQNDLATQFGLSDEIEKIDAPVSAVFGENWDMISSNVDDVVGRMKYDTGEGPDLIPADNGIGGADNNLANVPREDRYNRLNSFIEDELAPVYDLVLLDLPGKEDNIALNGLYAAESVIAPLQPGAFERQQLDRLEHDLRKFGEEYEEIDPQLEAVIPTMIDGRTRQSERFVDELQNTYPNVATDPVAKSQNIGNLQEDGRSLFDAEKDDLYNSGLRAREAYRQITDQLLDRLEAR